MAEPSAVFVIDPDPLTRRCVEASLARVPARVVGGACVADVAVDPAAARCRVAVVAAKSDGDPAAVVAALQTLAPGVRVVFTFASHLSGDPGALMRLPGAAAVLPRPFAPAALRAAVLAALE